MSFKRGTYPNSSIVRYSYHSRYKILKKLFESKNSVLDVGCDFGHLARIFSSTYRYLGIDPRSETIEYCKEESVGVSAFVNSFFPSDLVSEKYDLVIALTVLDEVSDKAKFLNALKDSLDVEGSLIVTVRNTNCWLHRKNSVSSQKGETVDDLSYFDYKSLFEKHGLYSEDLILPRPWITSLDVNGVKNFLATMHDKVLNRNDLNYTSGFLLSKIS
jgi:SAM-dependent methyltransferase